MKSQRKKNIITASWVSIVSNAVLAVLKLIIGFISGSLGVIGDGIDSSMDVLISIITLLTANFMSKPPSPKYAYGYEKADLIATKVLSIFIFFAGAQLIISSIKKLSIEQEPITPSMSAIYIIIFSIIVKCALSLYLKQTGRKNESSMLKANATNMKYDIFISATVLIGLFFTRYLNFPLADPITALIVGLWILRGAYKIFAETNTELMDGVDDPSVYDKIFEAVEEVDHVKNPHRVRSRSISGYYMIVIDIEIDGIIPLYKAHELANQVEQKIRDKIENIYDIVIHTEPIGNFDKNERKGISRQDIQ